METPALPPAIEVTHMTKVFRVLHRERTVKAAILRILIWQLPKWEEFVALEDLTFEVPAGQTVGVVGRNGSGKSTLLMLLARILRPTRGTITVRGRIASLLELGAGFQPEFTGFDNIYLNGVIYGMTRAQLDERIDEISQFADIGTFLDTQVKHYSSGMKARLGFAIAINVDPEVLLVDEALAVGDHEFQEKCYAKIEEFKRRGVTIFFVSHDSLAIRRVCDRVLWIHDHKLRADGPTAQVMDLYDADQGAVAA